MNDAPLEAQALSDALQTVGEWTVTEDGTAISRDFRFSDFRQAFAFMTECALAAEKMDHHPDWSNSYNRVGVSLSTHSAGGVTPRDIELAGIMDANAVRFAV